VVDGERVDRLLALVRADIDRLQGYRGRAADDPTALAAVKYHFITAIEGCARIAQHLIASEGWPVAEANAEAIRRLAAHGVLEPAVADAVATAVGFRNVLVHGYAEIDDARVVANLDRLDDLAGFVRDVARWLGEQG
jgi:uncharacterized protein YutE (UPF0331/DUF86 family)